MNRISDLPYVSEAEIVERVLLSVHRAIDENFPTVGQAQSRQFTKTVFGDVGESTAIVRPPVSDKMELPSTGKHESESSSTPPVPHALPPTPSSSSEIGRLNPENSRQMTATGTAESAVLDNANESLTSDQVSDFDKAPITKSALPRSLPPRKRRRERPAHVDESAIARLKESASQAPSRMDTNAIEEEYQSLITGGRDWIIRGAIFLLIAGALAAFFVLYLM